MKQLRISKHKLHVALARAKFKNWSELAKVLAVSRQYIYPLKKGERDIHVSTLGSLLLAFQERGLHLEPGDLLEWVEVEEEEEDEDEEKAEAPAVA